MQIFKKFMVSTGKLVSIILVLAILAMVNYVADRNFARLDLTADQQYTISPATIKTLNELKDVITIKVYFSKKLPPELIEVSQYVQDMLAEYSAYGKGNLKVLYFDPADDEKIKNEVLSLGIPEIQMNVMEKDQFQVQNGFLGIGVFYEDKTQILPVVQDTASLEYDLTSALKKVAAEKIKVVGFLTGQGEHLTDKSPSEQGKGDYTLVKKELEKNYKVENVVVENGKPIEGIDTLIVAGPTESFSSRDLFEIDQFIMKGGQAFFLLEGVKIGENLTASVNQTGLEKLLEEYGVKLDQNLIMDKSNATVSFSSGYMQFVVPYPFWPKLLKANFSKNSIVAKLESIVLPWASSLEEVKQEGVKTEILVTTSAYGGQVKSNFNLNPDQDFQPEGTREKFAMAIISTGKFNSYFADQPIPQVEEQKTPQGNLNLAENNGKVDDSGRQVINARQTDGRILVVGDADFASDSTVSRFNQNALFFLNAVDFLTLDSDLMTIRTRGVAERPLEELSEQEKFMIKFIGMALVPILVALFALIKMFVRRKRKQN